MTDQEKCQHCGVPIIPGLASEGAGWYHDLGEDDPASPLTIGTSQVEARLPPSVKGLSTRACILVK